MKLVFDIGATHLRVAEALPEGVGRVVREDTPMDPVEAISAFTRLASSFSASIEAAAGGVPAIVDEQGGIIAATNLPAWDGFAFGSELAHALAAPVILRNDAELAGLGEAVAGAGKGKRRVAYIGMGSGVGTSLIVEGEIVPHSSDGAMRERIIELAGGTTLEERAGGKSIEKQFGMAAADIPAEHWIELTAYLAEGVRNALEAWQPDIVVLGGSEMDETAGFRIEDIRAALETDIPIERAALGDNSGLEGARLILV